MKLAYVIGTYPSLTLTFIDREIRTLRKLGLQIQIISIRKPPSQILNLQQYDDLRDNIQYLLPVNWLIFFAAHLYFAVFRPITYFVLLGFLLSRPHPSFRSRVMTLFHFTEGVLAAYLLRREQCDQIHAHFLDRSSLVALCVGRLLKTPYSLTAHANDIYVKPVLVREKIAESRFTITVSEFNKSYLLNTYNQLDQDKIIVLHPWVDMEKFDPPSSKPENPSFRILSVGRLVEKKGHLSLIDACNFLKKGGMKFECYIVGDGPLKLELEKMVANYDLNDEVRFLGGVPQNEVLSQLSKADLFVLACTIAKDGDRDGMPVAIAEAMAMELPVISTQILGISELVRKDAGYLVPPDDSLALANAIQKMSELDLSARRIMGKAGRAVIEEGFSIDDGIRHLADMFLSKSEKIIQ